MRRLAAEPQLHADLERLRGRTLGCWCAPEPCHADVLVGVITLVHYFLRAVKIEHI